jgi:hypothetical protein
MYMNDMNHRMILQQQLMVDHVHRMMNLNVNHINEYDHLQLQQ